MKIAALFLAVAALAFLGGRLSVSPAPVPDAFTERQPLHRDDLLRRVNEERLKAGVRPLATRLSLDAFAAARLEAVAANREASGRCTHEGLGEAAEAAGLRQGVSENLVCDADSPDAAVAAWLASPTHRDTMLGEGYRYLGVATDGAHAALEFVPAL
jgi:Uncharacterized protein with SCP/PR1 domains